MEPEYRRRIEAWHEFADWERSHPEKRSFQSLLRLLGDAMAIARRSGVSEEPIEHKVARIARVREALRHIPPAR